MSEANAIIEKLTEALVEEGYEQLDIVQDALKFLGNRVSYERCDNPHCYWYSGKGCLQIEKNRRTDTDCQLNC